MAHETREIQIKEQINIESNSKKGPQKAAADHHSIGFRIRTARVHLPQSQAGIDQ